MSVRRKQTAENAAASCEAKGLLRAAKVLPKSPHPPSPGVVTRQER